MDRRYTELTAVHHNACTGHLHPISQMQYEIEDTFTSMGFVVLDGLNLNWNTITLRLSIYRSITRPRYAGHILDEDGNLLRTHTSAIQIRAWKRCSRPSGGGPGRVFATSPQMPPMRTPFTRGRDDGG
jgi:phenylalanyl-tRNA synthetase alpha chain